MLWAPVPLMVTLEVPLVKVQPEVNKIIPVTLREPPPMASVSEAPEPMAKFVALVTPPFRFTTPLEPLLRPMYISVIMDVPQFPI